MSVKKKSQKKKKKGQKCLPFNTRGLLVHKWLLYSTPALEMIIANPHCCLLLTCRVSLQLGVAVLGQGHGERGATWLTQQLKGSSSTPHPMETMLEGRLGGCTHDSKWDLCFLREHSADKGKLSQGMLIASGMSRLAMD